MLRAGVGIDKSHCVLWQLSELQACAARAHKIHILPASSSPPSAPPFRWRAQLATARPFDRRPYPRLPQPLPHRASSVPQPDLLATPTQYDPKDPCLVPFPAIHNFPLALADRDATNPGDDRLRCAQQTSAPTFLLVGAPNQPGRARNEPCFHCMNTFFWQFAVSDASLVDFCLLASFL
jgi:hypothetical protein